MAAPEVFEPDIILSIYKSSYGYVTIGGNRYEPQTFAYGAFPTGNIVAHPNLGYKFSHWELIVEELIKDSDFVLTNTDRFYNYSCYSDTITIYLQDYWCLDIDCYFEQVTVTVNLDNQSATTLGSTSVTATYGSAMPSITIPTRTGYTFGGYYTGTNGTGTQYYTATGASAKTCDLTSATTLYAKWTANTYTITLNTNGGAINSGNVTSYTYGTGATLPTNVTKTGYTFAGWYEDSTFSGTAVTSISATETGTKTYYAKWTANTYDIKFNLGDSGGGVSDTTYTFSESSQTMTIIEEPTRSGFDFSSWTAIGDGFSPTISGTTLTIPANCYGDITLTANWNATITVAENISGAAGILTGGGTFAEGDTATLTAYAKKGYNFVQWLKNGVVFNNNDNNQITVTVDGDATYTAVFEKAGISVEEFMVASTKGGVAYVVGQDASELEDDDTVTIMTKTCMVGYEFVGWYLDNDRTTIISENPSYRVAKSVAYKHVLVAVYREVTNSNVNTEVNN